MEHSRYGRLGRRQVAAVGREKHLYFLNAVGRVDTEIGLYKGAVVYAADLEGLRFGNTLMATDEVHGSHGATLA